MQVVHQFRAAEEASPKSDCSATGEGIFMPQARGMPPLVYGGGNRLRSTSSCLRRQTDVLSLLGCSRRGLALVTVWGPGWLQKQNYGNWC